MPTMNECVTTLIEYLQLAANRGAYTGDEEENVAAAIFNAYILMSCDEVSE